MLKKERRKEGKWRQPKHISVIIILPQTPSRSVQPFWRAQRVPNRQIHRPWTVRHVYSVAIGRIYAMRPNSVARQNIVPLQLWSKLNCLVYMRQGVTICINKKIPESTAGDKIDSIPAKLLKNCLSPGSSAILNLAFVPPSRSKPEKMTRHSTLRGN